MPKLTNLYGIGGRLVACVVAVSQCAAGSEISEKACEPAWTTMFGPSTHNGSVSALADFDDGSGPAMYAGGSFTATNGIATNRIAKWDGERWSALGNGLAGTPNGSVSALAVFDDGSGFGPALYVGGRFVTAGGQHAPNIARWNGTTWSKVGPGVNGDVNCLKVFDDGSGPALYAGGDFMHAGSTMVSRIAKWNGTQWSPMAEGLNATVWDLEVFDHGTGEGPQLFAGGSFTFAGTPPVNGLARWNGTSWEAFGDGPNIRIRDMEVFDDGLGDGPALYMSGLLTSAGGVQAYQIVRWNGRAWATLGNGMSSMPGALAVYNDGRGPALYAGGSFDEADGQDVYGIARWDGSTWSGLAGGLYGNNGGIFCLSVFDEGRGDGPRLWAGGSFGSIGGTDASYIATWNGSEWRPVGPAPNGKVSALAVYDDGLPGDPALYAGGSFTVAAGQSVNHIARWDGTSWSPLGTGTNNDVSAMCVFNDGAGDALYVGGLFTVAGGLPSQRIARWNGDSWSPAGNGIVNAIVYCFASYQAPGEDNPSLYVGGLFQMTSPGLIAMILRWNGVAWTPLPDQPNQAVRAMVVRNTATGPELVAAGSFTSVGTLPVNRIASWNGVSWSPLGTGFDKTVHSLAIHEGSDGVGPYLFAGGIFTTADGLEANHIAQWDGTSWSETGGGVDDLVSAMIILNAGASDDAVLVAGGSFETAGDEVVNRIAMWNGETWSALQGGMGTGVRTLCRGDEESDFPVLFAGGEFDSSPAGDRFVAEWHGCPVRFCIGDIAPLRSPDGVINVSDLLAVIGAWGQCGTPSNCPADIAPLGGNDVINVADLLAVIASWGPCP